MKEKIMQSRGWKRFFYLTWCHLFQLALIIPRDDVYVRQSLIGEKRFCFPKYADIRYPIEYMSRNQLRKYLGREDFLTVDETDIVVDIGASIGASTVALAPLAKHVVAIEPTPSAAECIKYNTRDFDNVSVIQKAVWNKSEQLDLQIGRASQKNSLIEPEHGDTGETVSVQAETLENIIADLDINEVNLLIADAEGVEPELIDGIGDLQINKISISTGPERYGEYTTDTVVNKLQNRGYETTVSGGSKRVVKAKL